MSDANPNATTSRSLVDLIDKLFEPSPPPPISMVPQTGGWVVLAILAAMAAGYATYRYIGYRRRNAYRQAALEDLAGAGENPAAIAAVLRRTALAAYPRRDVASLSGADWIKFLDRTADKPLFANGVGRALTQAPYTDDPAPATGLTQAARDWIIHHRGGPGA